MAIFHQELGQVCTTMYLQGSAAAQVVDVFLGGIEGLYSGDLELGRTAYDARTDCFRCAVRAPLTLRLYTTAQDGAFTHADIRGVLQ